MTALKKTQNSSSGYECVGLGDNFSDCPGLRPYDRDITSEAVRQLQEEADKDLAGEEWVLVEGYEFSR